MSQQLDLWCLRWRTREHSWRHVSEGGFNHLLYDVSLLEEAPARAFVTTHHYSSSWPAAKRRYALWEHDQLVGVAVLSVPVSKRTLTKVFPGLEPYEESIELGRFVLLDQVPANAESWFLARVFELATTDGFRGVISFSDPIPRQRADGTVVFPGHRGAIYQAGSLGFYGRGTARWIELLPDGTVLNERSKQKARAGEVGHAYVERLQARGPVRRVWHPGNYRYARRLGPRRRYNVIALPSLSYPKEAAA